MNRSLLRLVAVVVLLSVGCATTDPPPSNPAIVEHPMAPPDELPPPYTAEQIRDEWTTGFRLVLERTEAGGEPVVQRWAVIESDADQAKIEFATLDASGSPVGDPAVAQLGWTTLRDHAQFAPGSATREKVTRETDLGLLDGWLYTANEDGGLVTEYFFADGLPGAPVAMESRRGDEVVATLRQLERGRIDTP